MTFCIFCLSDGPHEEWCVTLEENQKDPTPWTRAQLKRGVRVQDLPAELQASFHFDLVSEYLTEEGVTFWVDAPPGISPQVLDVPRQSRPTP